ncbi:MAG: hypothetical protein IJV14_05810 [Lachnospiraceae bacterium]|nr:hypothetical protein [Lachnospiraceae bacterium]
MEIEKKWIVNGWPQADLPLLKREYMRQGYLTVEPTVRIRQETRMEGGQGTVLRPLLQEGDAEPSPVPTSPCTTEYILCFKSKGTLVRQEIEFPISETHFEQLEEMIGLPLIPKERRTYALPGGLELEVNHVDEGQPTEYWYAEVEFSSVEEAAEFSAEAAGLADYLNNDVTEVPGQTMGSYWLRTRCQ